MEKRKVSPHRHFQNYDWEPRQKMIEDLIMHQIKSAGVLLKYIPRQNFVRDELFGEDPYTNFDLAVDLEAWPKTVDQFEGQGDLFSKFGLEIKDQLTFSISRRRWQQIRSPKIASEHDYTILLEEATNSETGRSASIVMEDGTQNWSITSEDPKSGDLVYFPMVGKVFEISHVEHENLFYQHGKLMTYDLTCELFDYSQEDFNTGIDDIDNIEDIYSTELEDNAFTLEDIEGNILLENGGAMVFDDFDVSDVDRSSDNENIQTDAENIIDWSENSPFNQVDRFERW